MRPEFSSLIILDPYLFFLIKEHLNPSYLFDQLAKQLKNLYDYLIQTYANYYETAKVRLDLGAVNAIETLTIQSAMNKYKLLERQVDLEISTLGQQLKLTLNTNENVTTTDSLKMMQYRRMDDLHTIQEQLAQQGIQVEQALVPVYKADMKPGFNVGYAAQNYFENGWHQEWR